LAEQRFDGPDQCFRCDRRSDVAQVVKENVIDFACVATLVKHTIDVGDRRAVAVLRVDRSL
jgi:hypothetical protein